MKLTSSQITTFQETAWEYFHAHPRAMPWRENPAAYYVLVSELMLQQTQVPRVIPKFEGFIKRFPNIQALGTAKLSDVLSEWNGLGYNRRAKFLHQAAQMASSRFNGQIPDTYEALIQLPGVGPNTAGAILTYAFNQPVAFIETNIRTVYIHHFFDDLFDIDDKQILDVVKQTLDYENPREFYWALMDYGTHLKQTLPGRNVQSKHYKKQTPLAGSPREMRGRIIRALVPSRLSEATLRRQVSADERFQPALRSLEKEGMITLRNKKWSLTGGDDIR